MVDAARIVTKMGFVIDVVSPMNPSFEPAYRTVFVSSSGALLTWFPGPAT
jgi:hypothetical protein